MTSNDLKASAKDIASRAGATADDLGSAAGDAAADARQQGESVAASVRGAANDLYDKAQDGLRSALDNVPESASDAMAAGQRLYADSSRKVGRQIVRQPIEALLLAGAIGYLLGWATSRG